MREQANVSNILSFPIEWRQLETEKSQNDEMFQKTFHEQDNWSIKPVLNGKHNTTTKKDRYCAPENLSDDFMQWCHEMLRHPGSIRLCKTLSRTCCIKGLRSAANLLVKRWSTCQKHKKPKRKNGKLPAKKTEVTTCHTTCTDLAGPRIGDADESEKTLLWITIVDPVTH